MHFFKLLDVGNRVVDFDGVLEGFDEDVLHHRVFFQLHLSQERKHLEVVDALDLQELLNATVDSSDLKFSLPHNLELGKLL